MSMTTEMTRQEAAYELQWVRAGIDEYANTHSDPRLKKEISALDMAISALRPITREQVEKLWKGCPECKPRCGLCVHMGAWDKYGKPYVCEQCVDYSNFESEQKFCEVCGSPLTDEAVDMVMERLEEICK